MGLFQRLVQKTGGQAAAPADGAEQVTLSQLIDLLNLGGVPRSKLSEATYFTCLRVLSEGVSKLPLKLIRSTPERGVEEVREDPLYRVLRYRPNPPTDRHLLLGGHGDVPQPLRQRLRGHLRQRGKHPALAHAQRPGESVV